MADEIVPLPTAAKHPVPPQTHRGRYPKGSNVTPGRELRMRRYRRDEKMLALESAAVEDASRLDVRGALLNNQSDPTVPRPVGLDAAIDARAKELAQEAFELCREHLRRRVAYCAEQGWPKREINLDCAYRLIAEGDLGDALVREYRTKLQEIAFQARLAAGIGESFSKLVNEISEVTGGDR